MSDPELQAYRLGASRTLAEKNRVGKATIDRTERDFASPDRGMRMQQILPPELQAGFDARIHALRDQSSTRRAAQGNSTTAKQLREGADDEQPAEAVRRCWRSG